jgi:hypothetical protein
MNYPPSLAADVKARAFVASNGELGILPDDAQTFLRACEADSINLLGWEMWLVEHMFVAHPQAPVLSRGNWCGLIPLRGSSMLSVVGGSGNRTQTEREVSGLVLDEMVAQPWLVFIRLNFTLAG